MWVFRAVEFVKWLGSLLLSVVVFLSVTILSATAFPLEGEKEYYLYASSSQAVIKSDVSILDLPFVHGESVRINSADGVLEDVLIKYSARVVRVEEFAGGVSYYCYSPKLKKGIVIEGVAINLQIAVKGESVVLGTPIIFGGY